MTRLQHDPVRPPEQRHSSLFRRAVRLPVIAWLTSSDQVLIGRLPASSSRAHVVERERAGSNRYAAVLAAFPVALQDVATRHSARRLRNLRVVKQTDHTRKRDRLPRRVNEERRSVLNLGRSLDQERQRAARGHDVYRQIGRVQDEDVSIQAHKAPL